MAEQSSTVAAFRALIMLVCLLLVPVAAFCGGSFPAVVKAIQSGHWPTLADFHGPSGPASTQTSEAPRFMPAPTASMPQGTSSKLAGFPNPSGNLDASDAEGRRSQVIRAGYNSPVIGGALPSTSFPQNKDPGSGPVRGLSPVPPGMGSLVSLDRPDMAGHSDVSAPPHDATGGTLPNNQLKYVLDRLRQLGATYFLLEPCPDEKGEFRFFCKMSVGGNPEVTKPFWCFDSDPLMAMTRVLKDVEEWHVGSR